MKKYYEINKVTFEEVLTPKAKESLFSRCRYNWNACADIYEAYKNPSVYKVKAFNFWKDFARKIEARNLTIVAHGVQTFSLTFDFDHPETNEPCKAYITRDCNRFAKVQ